MANDEHKTAKTDVEQTEQAREAERVHRALQQQGEEAGDATPPRERERHEAVDHAIEDVERTLKHAAQRRVQAAREPDDA